jgi:hypothetical protein
MNLKCLRAVTVISTVKTALSVPALRLAHVAVPHYLISGRHTNPSSKTILSTILPHGDAASRDGYDAAVNTFHRQPPHIPAAHGASLLLEEGVRPL